jgi:hypothetical protein
VPPPPRRLKRRLFELGALLILLPGLVGIRWYDDANHAVTQDPHRRVTIVPRGTWVTVGHNRLRMVGRREASTAGTTAPTTSGASQLTLVLEAKVLDAQGGKDLGKLHYEFRDRSGHVWSAAGGVNNPSVSSEVPPAGSITRIVVIGVVPRAKLSSVVLDSYIQPFQRSERKVLYVFRFAH